LLRVASIDTVDFICELVEILDQFNPELLGAEFDLVENDHEADD
jgi:hypothetical protein